MNKQTILEEIKKIFQKPNSGRIRIFVQGNSEPFEILPASGKYCLDIEALNQTEAEEIVKSLILLEK